MKEPLIDRARRAFASYRGLGREIIDELTFALTVANKEVERLRESRAELLDAAKEALDLLDRGHHAPASYFDKCHNHLKSALEKAEGLGK